MTKAAVVRPDGTEVSSGSAPTPWRPVPTGAEMSPIDVLDAVGRAVTAALGTAPPGPVVGVGVTSMAETVAFLGADGHPVAASIAWHDTRGEEEAEELARTFGQPAFSARTGLAPAPICTLVKLAWLTRHGDIVPARALSMADWVVYALGGEQVAEASLSSRTGALSLAGRRWWSDGLEWAGVGADLFPPVVKAGELVGKVTGGALERLPGPLGQGDASLARLRGACLASAGHDHLCVAPGVGATGPEQLLDSCGSAEGLLVSVPPLDAKQLEGVVSAGLNAGWHTLPDRYALLGGQSLGLTLWPVLHLLGVRDDEDLASFDRAALGVPAGSLRLLRDRPFGSPYVVGIGGDASPAALWNAALDTVCERAALTVATMMEQAGPRGELVLTGGWSRCEGLRHRKHSLLPSVRWPAVGEGGARGAALFGGWAAGLFNGPDDFPAPEESPWGPAPTSLKAPPGGGH
jgi:sugar (pentulose or hexulose) kinase